MPGLCGLVFMHQEAAMGNRHTDGHRCVLVHLMRTGRQLVSGHTAGLACVPGRCMPRAVVVGPPSTLAYHSFSCEGGSF